MRLVPLCSGSSGNATLVEAGGLRLLVDAGGTGRRIEALLTEAGAAAPAKLRAATASSSRKNAIGSPVLPLKIR